MKLVQNYPILGSSINDSELSLRVKGYLLALLPIIMSMVSAFGWSILESEIIQFINIIVIGLSIYSIVWGWIRKYKNN